MASSWVSVVFTIAAAILNLFTAYLAMLAKLAVNEAKIEILGKIENLYPTRREIEPQLNELRRRIEALEEEHTREHERRKAGQRPLVTIDEPAHEGAL
jgi:hypothetical protein